MEDKIINELLIISLVSVVIGFNGVDSPNFRVGSWVEY